MYERKLSKNYSLILKIRTFVKFRKKCIKIRSKNGDVDEKSQFCEMFGNKLSKILTNICQIAEIGAVQKNAHLVETLLLLSFFLESAKFREITSKSSFLQGEQAFLQT